MGWLKKCHPPMLGESGGKSYDTEFTEFTPPPPHTHTPTANTTTSTRCLPPLREYTQWFTEYLEEAVAYPHSRSATPGQCGGNAFQIELTLQTGCPLRHKYGSVP